MPHGNPWIPEKHDPILKAWAGRIRDKEIGTITGHGERKVRERRNELGLAPFHAQRIGWSPRDYLLADAALSYELSDNLSLQVNANNLFDKEYIVSCGFGSCYYGTGLRVLGGLSYHW